MKKSLFTLLLIFNFFCLSAQENTSILKEEKEEYSFIDLEEIPIFPGCEEIEKKERIKCFQTKISEHIVSNLNYPEEARNNKIQGRVSVRFIINKEGNIDKIATKGPLNGILLEKEARRIISLLPKMTPGIQNGKPADVLYSIPISFKLN